MIALAYLGLAWFFGMMVADVLPPAEEPRVQASGAVSTCRPWCAMSGSFKNGVLRPMVPWPFRRGKFYECPRHGDRDYCSNETFIHGQWMPPDVILAGSTSGDRAPAGCSSEVRDLRRRLDSAQRCCGHEIPEDRIINGWDGTIIPGSEIIREGRIDTTKL